MDAKQRQKIIDDAKAKVQARHEEPKEEKVKKAKKAKDEIKGTAAAVETPVEATSTGTETPAASESATTKAKKVTKAAASGMPDLPKLPTARKAHKARPKKPCSCGCGGETTGNWVPGHDARARGWAIRIERGLLKMSDVPENERQGAKLMLAERKKAVQPNLTVAVDNTQTQQAANE